MNYLRPFIALFLAMTIFIPVTKAQDNFDVNRMNRDLNIMENILGEMFKTQHTGSDNTYVISAGALMRSDNIRGTYLPDFGVIFLIPDFRTSFFAFDIGGDATPSFSFVYRDDKEKDTGITEDSIIDRIREFLRDYGSTIGQLAPDDKVMILYGANRDRRLHGTWAFSDNQKQDDDKINTLSVVASKQDLDAYRSSRISAADFDKRVSVSRVSKDDRKHLDMEVLANIFETAFKDPEGKSFRIHGSVNHLLLDNFGALFFFDASYTSGENVFILGASKSRLHSGSSADASESRSRAEAIVKSITAGQDNDETDAEKQEELKNAYSAFVSQLKEYLVDYGRTLSSVKSDQMILLSVSMNTHYESIPERIDVQVKKSVLEAMDRGNTTRDEALEQVVVREY